MMDVHAPEHRVSGLRDFLVHMFTITCGLLIALGLENAAEAWHHRNEKREAEEKIRQELKENQQSIRELDGIVRVEIGDLTNILGFLEARQGTGPSSDTPAAQP